MKNIFKKNQVIITALAIMIAVAGYLSFTQNKVKAPDDSQLTATSDDGTVLDGDDSAMVEDIIPEDVVAEDANSEVANVGDETTDVTAEDANTTTDISAEDMGNDDTVAVSDTGEAVASTDTKDNVGEAVLVSNTIGSDYFVSAKLKREQTRAQNKETLMAIVDNANVSEKQKQEALDQVLAATEAAAKETATENLLAAKGFNDAFVHMYDGKVDVVVNVNDLTQQQMAQIEDIVKNKTEVALDKITITPVAVKDKKE